MSKMICVTDLNDHSDMIFNRDFINSILPYKAEGDTHAYYSVVQLKDNSRHFIRESVRTINDLLCM
jgi:hypothetical protein